MKPASVISCLWVPSAASSHLRNSARFHEIVEHIVEGIDGRRRVQRDAGLLAQRFDVLDCPVKMRAGFGMNGHDVRAGVGEGIEERIGRRDHQVDVERLPRVEAKRLHHARTDGEVGHKMAVHHVDMDPVGAGLVDRMHFLAELREVGGQDRRCDDWASHRPD